MSLFHWHHRRILGVLAWNSAEHGRASKAAAEMKVLMSLISVLLVHCVTSDFQSTFSSMLGNLPVGQYYSINKGAGRKEKMFRFFQIELEKKQIGSKEIVISLQ